MTDQVASDAIAAINRVFRVANERDVPYPLKLKSTPSANYVAGYRDAQAAVLRALAGDA